MSYKSQLKAWAIDRVTELWKATGHLDGTMDEMFVAADRLVDYTYDAEKDFTDTVAHVSQLLKQQPNALDKVNQMIAELNVIQEEIERQANMQLAAANASLPKETVQ